MRRGWARNRAVFVLLALLLLTPLRAFLQRAKDDRRPVPWVLLENVSRCSGGGPACAVAAPAAAGERWPQTGHPCLRPASVIASGGLLCSVHG